MKYICTNDFPNPVGNPISIADVKDEAGKVTRQQAPLPNGTVKDKSGKDVQAHIHKGVIFNIGSAAEYADLAPAEKTLVAQLVVSKKIVPATPDTIKKVDLEVAADKARVERDALAAKNSKGATVSEILEAMPELLAAAIATALQQAGVGKKA